MNTMSLVAKISAAGLAGAGLTVLFCAASVSGVGGAVLVGLMGASAIALGALVAYIDYQENKTAPIPQDYYGGGPTTIR